MCCPQPVQVTFPQDEHEAGEHILISYVSSSLPGDEWGVWGGVLQNQSILRSKVPARFDAFSSPIASEYL